MAARKVTFAGAMGKVNSKAWEEARTAEPGGFKREVPDIADGNYPCVVSKIATGVTKQNAPYVSINLTVESGQYEGVKLDKFHQVVDQGKDLGYIVKDLKAIGYEEAKKGVSPDVWIEACAADANESNPRVLVGVKNDTYTPTQGENAGQEVPVLRVYINRPLEDGDNGSDEAPVSPKKAAKSAPKKAAPKKAAKGKR